MTRITLTHHPYVALPPPNPHLQSGTELKIMGWLLFAACLGELIAGTYWIFGCPAACALPVAAQPSGGACDPAVYWLAYFTSVVHWAFLCTAVCMIAVSAWLSPLKAARSPPFSDFEHWKDSVMRQARASNA